MFNANLRLEAQHLSFAYGSRSILRDVSCNLRPGELTALIGPNGAGKSTLLRMLAHLTVGTQGQVVVDKIGALHTLSPEERAKYIGWVGDHGPLPFSFSVFDTVRLGRYGWHKGMPSQRDDDATHAALQQMEIDHLARRDVTSLSSGERQKTMIARLLAAETPILLLDEPLANLDIGSSLRLLTLLRKKARDGATVCLTIHDLSLAYRFADRVLCLEGGALVADGPAKDVLVSGQVSQALGVESTIEPGLLLTTKPQDASPKRAP